MDDEIAAIVKLLEAKRLKEALIRLSMMASFTTDWQLRNDVEALQTSYDLMLQYTMKGMKDPNKKDIYDKLIRRAYELTDRANIMMTLPQAHSLYYEVLRTHLKTPPHTLSELQMQLEAYTEDMGTAPLLFSDENRREQELIGIRKRHEMAINGLFEKVWVTIGWNDSEVAEARSLLNSLLVQPNDLAVFISAITMSLLKVFDIRKYLFLLEAYRHPDVQVNQRAIVGIAIAAIFHDERIMLYPEALAQLSLLNEDTAFIKNLNTIQIQFLLSRETQRINKKMREEIIPEMMKNPELRNPKIGFEDTEETDDRNPEWEKWIDKSGITDKLKEMGELQMAGADVYMSTFSQLKHYQFFRQMSHWFYPFDRQQTDIASFLDDNTDKLNGISIVNLLLDSNAFCNSDKYSFCFTLMQIPENQRKMMAQQLGQQNELSEEQRDQLKEMIGTGEQANFVSRQYIHDLYRFFKLWSRSSEMDDIFDREFSLWQCESLKEAVTRPEELSQIAAYLLQNNYMQEAYELYDILILEDGMNAELWQKAGYALQKMNRCEDALEYYEQADVLAPDNLWINRHLAQCYRKVSMPKRALEYYKKVEAVTPDNLNLSLQIGQCLVELKRYSEALAYFFKVEYLEKNPAKARRALGWCSFVTGKYQEARKYYDQLLQASKPKMQDFMNAGHVYIALGDYSKALELYDKAQGLCNSRDEFIAIYLNDKEHLLEQGFTEVDIHILLDELL